MAAALTYGGGALKANGQIKRVSFWPRPPFWRPEKHFAAGPCMERCICMEIRDIFRRVRSRVREARERVGEQGQKAAVVMRSAFDEEWIDRALEKARETLAPRKELIPVDFQLRQHSLPRRIYERVLPLSHVMRLQMRYERPFLDDFMPVGPDSYIGRGSYKFVYSLPWRMVVKVGKNIMPSDPLCGSLFREVAREPEKFLKKEELELMEFLCRGRTTAGKEKIRFNFFRLGLERYSYAIVKQGLPDMVLPTRFFMGIRYRRSLFGRGHTETMRPMDTQLMLVGKHLKELAVSGKKAKQGRVGQFFNPKFEFEFDIGRFGAVKKKQLEKIRDDLLRLVGFTEALAEKEKLILDIHTENLIITIPEFELKVFDFHIFDEHLYTAARGYDRPEQEHIEVIGKFIDSFGL